MAKNEEKEQAMAELVKYTENRDSLLKAQCAINLVKSKLQIINSELSLARNHSVLVSMQDRIKTTESVYQKLKRKNLPCTGKAIEENITDMAGVRAVCAFEDDIYRVSAILLKQPDIKLAKKKDYIKNPKKSGYRSLHLIIHVPVYLSTGVEWIKVEVQLRTSAMNFWADLDHQLRYKKGAKEARLIGKELKEYADRIKELDEHMVEMRKKIEAM
ncbi:GTP pyrophosphokinase [Hespellia stercorisuis]|uniref:Putative GTP pyrophosphokinase n=1 Tax=Hespellia stercorisuis DSM 15480 TaxID=1121950 RepID=A0A1M6VWU0_9FIRM|nr:GTP pyrophosphokinase [Hespellia stercorisuis]SHK85785.1 putative GTP pyrophosphokinase [Hespellia stercorisuis DSM 15480]